MSHAPPNEPMPIAAEPDLNAIKIPLLISGILNALTAAGLLVAGLLTIIMVVGCFILPFAIPVGVLAYFEIKTYMDLDKPGDKRHLKPRVQLLGILEIATVLLGNVLVVVCGVLVVSNVNKLDETA